MAAFTSVLPRSEEQGLQSRSQNQEHGSLSVGPDGALVRDVTAVGADGSEHRFRQTFQTDGPDRIISSIARATPSGWAPSFPGADHIVMTRRAD